MLVPGTFPNTAVWGLVTCNNTLATERTTYNFHSKQIYKGGVHSGPRTQNYYMYYYSGKKE